MIIQRSIIQRSASLIILEVLQGRILSQQEAQHGRFVINASVMQPNSLVDGVDNLDIRIEVIDENLENL